MKIEELINVSIIVSQKFTSSDPNLLLFIKFFTKYFIFYYKFI